MTVGVDADWSKVPRRSGDVTPCDFRARRKDVRKNEHTSVSISPKRVDKRDKGDQKVAQLVHEVVKTTLITDYATVTLFISTYRRFKIGVKLSQLQKL